MKHFKIQGKITLHFSTKVIHESLKLQKHLKLKIHS